MCSITIILMVLQAPLASSLSHEFDTTSMMCVFTLWLFIQVWFVLRVCQFLRATHRQMQHKYVAETMRLQCNTQLQMNGLSALTSFRRPRGATVAPTLASALASTLAKPNGAQ